MDNLLPTRRSKDSPPLTQTDVSPPSSSTKAPKAKSISTKENVSPGSFPSSSSGLPSKKKAQARQALSHLVNDNQSRSPSSSSSSSTTAAPPKSINLPPSGNAVSFLSSSNVSHRVPSLFPKPHTIKPASPRLSSTANSVARAPAVIAEVEKTVRKDLTRRYKQGLLPLGSNRSVDLQIQLARTSHQLRHFSLAEAKLLACQQSFPSFKNILAEFADAAPRNGLFTFMDMVDILRFGQTGRDLRLTKLEAEQRVRDLVDSRALVKILCPGLEIVVKTVQAVEEEGDWSGFEAEAIELADSVIDIVGHLISVGEENEEDEEFYEEYRFALPIDLPQYYLVDKTKR